MQDRAWHLKYCIAGSEESHRKSQVSKNNNLNSTVEVFHIGNHFFSFRVESHKVYEKTSFALTWLLSLKAIYCVDTGKNL